MKTGLTNKRLFDGTFILDIEVVLDGSNTKFPVLHKLKERVSLCQEADKAWEIHNITKNEEFHENAKKSCWITPCK